MDSALAKSTSAAWLFEPFLRQNRFRNLARTH
jgi:hypothetical protein